MVRIRFPPAVSQANFQPTTSSPTRHSTACCRGRNSAKPTEDSVWCGYYLTLDP